MKLRIFKTKKMEKNLKIDESTARRIYPTCPPEMKEILENTFGKQFFSQKITDRVKDYDDILQICGVRKLADEVTIEGFDNDENEVIRNIIKKMRICKVYNEGHRFKRGESRWYPWYNVSSGFVFHVSTYDHVDANVSSAARLCFKNEDLVKDYDAKFRHIEEKIIDLK